MSHIKTYPLSVWPFGDLRKNKEEVIFMRTVQRFQNMPTDKPTTELATETKGSFPVGGIFVAGIKILLVLGVIGFLGFKLVIFSRDVISKRQEILFAISHPDMIKPIRELYEKGHQQVDSDLKQILIGGK